MTGTKKYEMKITFTFELKIVFFILIKIGLRSITACVFVSWLNQNSDRISFFLKLQVYQKEWNNATHNDEYNYLITRKDCIHSKIAGIYHDNLCTGLHTGSQNRLYSYLLVCLEPWVFFLRST